MSTETAVEWLWENLTETQQREQGRWLRRLGIGERYHAWSGLKIQLDSSGKSDLADWCMDVSRAIHDGRGLLFWGGTGTGKTTLLRIMAGAVWAHNQAHAESASQFQVRDNGEVVYLHDDRRQITVKYVHGASMMNSLDVFPEHLDECLAPLRRCDLLLIDDLGVIPGSVRARGNFDGLIEYRYMHRKSTCIATNLPPKTLAQPSLYRRAMDRFCDGEWMRIHHVTGGSLRQPWRRR